MRTNIIWCETTNIICIHVHNLTPQINTVKVSERQTNTQLNFSALLYVGLFFFSNRGLSDLKGITQVQTQRRRLISVSNFTQRLAENPHRTTEAYLLISFSSFPAIFPIILFLMLFLFFSKFSDAVRWIVLSVRGLVGDLATRVAKVMVNKRVAAG